MPLFKAQIEHDPQGRPEMVLYPTFERIGSTAASYHIPLSDAWLYSEEHNPSFVDNMKNLVRRVGEFFDLYPAPSVIWTPPSREEMDMMVDIAATIQNHLDELVATVPKEKNRGKQIGEATTYVKGQRVTRPIHEYDGLDRDDVLERKVTFWEGAAPDNSGKVIPLPENVNGDCEIIGAGDH